MREKKLPPYAPILMESTRAVGYSLETAAADIIDNSIAASASRAEVFFFPVGEPYIAFLDNGVGMNEEELDTAMQYGSKNPVDRRNTVDLGRFGLGLKTASLSQCRCLSVISKQGSVLTGRRWDLDHVADARDWSLLLLDQDDIEEVPEIQRLQENSSGTLVVWQDLDRLQAGEVQFEQTFGRKMDVVRDHLALVYHRYLSGEAGIKKLRIEINGERILPADPFLKEKSTRPMDDEAIIIRGEKVLVRPYILPHISRMTSDEIGLLGGKEGLRRHQGFYVYRNKRLLVWGTWFRMMRQGDMSKLARIQVDLSNALDDLWALDIKKSSALPPAEVRENLRSIIERIAEKSKRTWTFRGKREISDTTVHVWNRLKTPSGGVYYEINREHPLVQQLTDCHESLKKPLLALLLQIEKSIPLNQLYVDLTNDEKVDNDQEQDSAAVGDALRALLEMSEEKEGKLSQLEIMAGIEPFSLYPDVCHEIREEILGDEQGIR
jgi:hypothetical protein